MCIKVPKVSYQKLHLLVEGLRNSTGMASDEGTVRAWELISIFLDGTKSKQSILRRSNEPPRRRTEGISSGVSLPDAAKPFRIDSPRMRSSAKLRAEVQRLRSMKIAVTIDARIQILLA